MDLPQADSFFQVVGAPAGAGATAPPDNVVLVPPQTFAEVTRGSAVVHQFHVLLDRSHSAGRPRRRRRLGDGPGEPPRFVGCRRRTGRRQPGRGALRRRGRTPSTPASSSSCSACPACSGVRRGRAPGRVAIGEQESANPRCSCSAGPTAGWCSGLPPARASFVGVVGIVLGLLGGVVCTRLILPGTPLSPPWFVAASVIGLVLAVVAAGIPALRAVTRFAPRVRRCGRHTGAVDPATVVPPDGPRFHLAGSSSNRHCPQRPERLSGGRGPGGGAGHRGELRRAPWTRAGLARPGAPDLAGDGLGCQARTGTRGPERPGKGPRIGRLDRSPPQADHRPRGGRACCCRRVSDCRRPSSPRRTTNSPASTSPSPSGRTSRRRRCRGRSRALAGADRSRPPPPRPPSSHWSIGSPMWGRTFRTCSGSTRAPSKARPRSRIRSFPGSTIQATLAAMSATRDGVLLSAETIRDYQLHVGDQVRLRLPVGSSGYQPVTFHVVGQISEFPTAPKDSFIVANADYVGAATGSHAVSAFLVASSNPTQTASYLQQRLGPGWHVQDITSARKTVVTASGLAATDLCVAGPSRARLRHGLRLRVRRLGHWNRHRRTAQIARGARCPGGNCPSALIVPGRRGGHRSGRGIRGGHCDRWCARILCSLPSSGGSSIPHRTAWPCPGPLLPCWSWRSLPSAP